MHDDEDNDIPPNPMIHYLAKLAYENAKTHVRKKLEEEAKAKKSDNAIKDNSADQIQLDDD